MELLNKPVLEINNNTQKPILSIKISDKIPEPIYDNDLLNKLNKYKNMIDNIKNIKIWDYCKKLSNNYELLHHYIRNKSTNLGIANYDPISRSFFKFWEILQDFNLIDNKKENITYAALAEGPGGFIEAFNFYRRKYKVGHVEDQINCITLKPYNNEIPGWKNSNRLFKECSNYNISWGVDETGSLYNLENIKYFTKLFKNNKADLVSADGGFDFSSDYSNQEVSATRLVLCEIITGLSILAVNGNMVIKVYDIFQKSTIDIIYLLSYYFDKCHIVKPYTSRAANSEKYLVCKNFKGIEEEELEKLYGIVEEYEIISTQNKYLERIISNKIPADFLDLIYSQNIYHISQQIKCIITAMVYIRLKLNNNEVNNIKNNQTVYSLSWCKKYDFPVNPRCRYLQKNNQYNYIPNY
jgi:hypothetical protein